MQKGAKGCNPKSVQKHAKTGPVGRTSIKTELGEPVSNAQVTDLAVNTAASGNNAAAIQSLDDRVAAELASKLDSSALAPAIAPLATAAALATTDGQVAAHGSSIAALQSSLTTGLSNKADQSAFDVLEGVVATKSTLELSNYSTTAAMNGSIASANNATLATVAANYGLKTVVDQHSLEIAARITPLVANALLGAVTAAALASKLPSQEASISGLQASKADASALDSKIATALLDAITTAALDAALLGKDASALASLLSTVDGLDTLLEEDTKIANALLGHNQPNHLSAGGVPFGRRPGHGNGLEQTIAQVDGLLAGKLGVTEAASALQIAVRFPDDGGADEAVAAIGEQILGPTDVSLSNWTVRPSSGCSVVLATHTAGVSVDGYTLTLAANPWNIVRTYNLTPGRELLFACRYRLGTASNFVVYMSEADNVYDPLYGSFAGDQGAWSTAKMCFTVPPNGVAKLHFGAHFQAPGLPNQTAGTVDVYGLQILDATRVPRRRGPPWARCCWSPRSPR